MKSVAVVGSGVIGLTTAIELARSFQVVVFSHQPLLSTTSAIATAMWHVYLVDPNAPVVLKWAQASLNKFLALAKTTPESGLTVIRGIELFRKSPCKVPPWRDIPPQFRMLNSDDLQAFPGITWGYEISAPLAEMRRYLPWLKGTAEKAGVSFVARKLASLEDVGRTFDVVVNCAGLGARELIEDMTLRPVRGQYVILERGVDCPDTYVGDDENPGGMSYAIPREFDVCVGGTEEYDVEQLVFDVDENAMLRRASKFFPWIFGAKPRILERVVGLRPFRQGGVCLEIGTLADGRPLIHNYGHGGSGFSLSWGCAYDVVRLAVG